MSILYSTFLFTILLLIIVSVYYFYYHWFKEKHILICYDCHKLKETDITKIISKMSNKLKKLL